jgi:hypothetical protein
MKTIILIVLAVTVAPFVRADSFAGKYTATSGFFTGPFGGPFMLAGNNFTLTGTMELAGPCPSFYSYGQPIQGCDDGQGIFIKDASGTSVLKERRLLCCAHAETNSSATGLSDT